MRTVPPVTISNLLGPCECEVPLPINRIVKRHRFFQTMNVVIPAATGEPGGRSSGFHNVVAPPSLMTLALAGRSVDEDTTAIDMLGGVPIGSLRASDVRRLEQPVLAQASVKSIEELVTAGKVRLNGRARPVELTAESLEQLADSGRALMRIDGHRLTVKLDAPARGVRTEIVRVGRCKDVVRDGGVRTADGEIMPVSLTARQVRQLESGAPVAVKEGSRRAVLIPAAPALADRERQPMSHAASAAPSPEPGEERAEERAGASYRRSTSESPAALHLILPFEMTWVLKGYERGELVSSISLTPLEETTIEVFSWDRRRTSVDDTISSESESSSDSQSMDRDSQEMFNEMTKTGQFNWSAKATVQFKVQLVNVSAESGGGTTQNTGDIARGTQQHVRERIQKASERVKASRQTKISESAEFGSETRTTRRLRNQNLCHAVSYNYFEVLRRYESTITCLAEEAGLAVLVDNHLADEIDFGFNSVRHEELTLRKTLLDRGLAEGFEAARLLHMYDDVCSTLCHSCACPWDAPSGPDVERAEALAVLESLAQAVIDLDMIVKGGTWNWFFHKIFPLDPPLGATMPPGFDAEQWFRSWAFVELWLRTAPADWRRLLRAASAVATAQGKPREAALFTLGSLVATLDHDKLAKVLTPDAGLQFILLSIVKDEARRTYKHISTLIAASSPAGVSNILLGVVGILTGSLSTIFGAFFVGTVTAAATLEHIVGTVAGLVGGRPGITSTDDGGLAALTKRAGETYAAMRASEKSATKLSESDAKADREARKAAVSSIFPPGKLLHARERFNALQAHLLRYADYYRFHILMERRAAGVDLRPPFIAAIGNAVETTPFALIDGKLAYRVALDVMSGARALLETLVNKKNMPAPTEVDEFTLPTPGLVVEPKLSSCHACDDFIMEGREIELMLRRQQAAQAELEVARLKARLEHEPPLLDKENVVALPVTVRMEPALPVTTTTTTTPG